jgi:hypothetical protein
MRLAQIRKVVREKAVDGNGIYDVAEFHLLFDYSDAINDHVGLYLTNKLIDSIKDAHVDTAYPTFTIQKLGERRPCVVLA